MYSPTHLVTISYVSGIVISNKTVKMANGRTHTHTDRQRERESGRERERKRERQTDRQTNSSVQFVTLLKQNVLRGSRLA